MTVQMIKVSRSFTITHRDLQYDIKNKYIWKNQLFLNIYNKLVTYNWTTNIIKTLQKKIKIIHKPIIRELYL
jgi:archaellum biogenesis ATPase FlaH